MLLLDALSGNFGFVASESYKIFSVEITTLHLMYVKHIKCIDVIWTELETMML